MSKIGKHYEGCAQAEFGFAAAVETMVVRVRRLARFERGGELNTRVAYVDWLEFYSPLSSRGAATVGKGGAA